MTAGVRVARAQQANPGRVPFIYRFDGRRSFETLLDWALAGGGGPG